MKKNKNITGFKTPENYFEGFEERLFGKIAEENFPKTTGHSIPNGYFENMEDRVLKTVGAKEKPTKVRQLFPKQYFGYAAAIAACLLIAFTVFNFNTDSSSLDSVQLAAIDAYIEEGNLNLDLYDLTSYIDDEDITNLNFDDHQFSETSLEEYILENMEAEIILSE